MRYLALVIGMAMLMGMSAHAGCELTVVYPDKEKKEFIVDGKMDVALRKSKWRCVVEKEKTDEGGFKSVFLGCSKGGDEIGTPVIYNSERSGNQALHLIEPKGYHIIHLMCR